MIAEDLDIKRGSRGYLVEAKVSFAYSAPQSSSVEDISKNAVKVLIDHGFLTVDVGFVTPVPSENN